MLREMGNFRVSVPRDGLEFTVATGQRKGAKGLEVGLEVGWSGCPQKTVEKNSKDNLTCYKNVF